MLKVLKEADLYRFYLDDDLMAQGLVPDFKGPFRIFIYGIGDSVTEWDYVRVLAKQGGR